MVKTYALISGAVFAIVSLVQLTRALNQWPVQVGTWTVPVWISWIAFVVAGSLAAWAFTLAVRHNPDD
ncbi:MAG: hypothetical protein HYR49_05670 [Gammaproteobacteria bacterium]|nr:hypothetical protein [Gammaproteobacteria bacterium]